MTTKEETNFVERLGVEMVYERRPDELHTVLKQGFDIETPRYKRSNYASELTGCKRKRYWDWTDEPCEDTFDDKSRIVMASGEAWEDLILKFFKGARVYKGTQIRLDIPELRIGGNIDAIIVTPGGKLIPVEIKSTSDMSYKSKYLYSCPECNGEAKWNSRNCKNCNKMIPGPVKKLLWYGKSEVPDSSHYAQLQAYIQGTKFIWRNPVTGELQTEFDEGRLLVVNRGFRVMDDIMWYRIKKDDNFWSAVSKDVTALNTSVDNGELPNRDYDPAFNLQGVVGKSADFYCKFCPYQSQCFEAPEIQDGTEE